MLAGGRAETLTRVDGGKKYTALKLKKKGGGNNSGTGNFLHTPT